MQWRKIKIKEWCLWHTKLIFQSYSFVKTQLNKQSFRSRTSNGSIGSKTRLIFKFSRTCRVIFKVVLTYTLHRIDNRFCGSLTLLLVFFIPTSCIILYAISYTFFHLQLIWTISVLKIWCFKLWHDISHIWLFPCCWYNYASKSFGNSVMKWLIMHFE